MLRSLYAAVSGVKGHQTLLDVTGNNIANVNTPGFKKSVVYFQDLMYQANRGATSPDSENNQGGTDPMQVGLGVNIGSIETIHTQGNTQYTGNRNDMAISGDGYFVVKSGSKTYYTRAGDMILDGENNMVTSGTGYMLQGYQMVQDPNDPTVFNASSTLANVNIPVGQKLEAKETTLVGYKCNLNSQVDTYLPMGVTGNDASVNLTLGGTAYKLNQVTSGTTRATFMTLSNGTDAINLTYAGLDTTSGLPILTATGAGGLAGATFAYDSTSGKLTVTSGGDTQILDLAGMMDFKTVTDATVTPQVNYLVEFNDIAASGNRQIVVWDATGAADPQVLEIPMNADGTFNLGTATQIGTADLDVKATSDGLGLTLTNHTSGATVSTLNQRVASVHTTKVDVYDSLGNVHTLETSWEKIDNNQWRWRAWLPSEPGITLTGNTGIVNFTAEGLIEGTDTFDIGLNFASLGAEDATIKLDFSGRSFGEEPIQGVTQYGSAFTTKAYYQDGYEMGVLNDYSVGTDGTISGVYSNGQTRPLYRIALALFANPQGLNKEGDSVFSESANSGMAQINMPTEGGAGKIMGSTLEMANVDLSDEFVRLITAQRGFQANARVVTTSDQVLEELINLKR